MTTRTNVSPLGVAAGINGAKAGFNRAAKSLAAKASAWIDTCADYYAAAAIYEHLSKLSEAELRRRGLSHTTLASEIARTCGRIE